MKIDELINVGIADIKYSDKSTTVLRTILGSCVGICIYDPEKQAGGMAHIMLPRMKDEKSNFMKYADTSIPHLIEELEKFGCQKSNMVAKIAGGSSMFKTNKTSFMAEIGKNNIEVVQRLLRSFGIPILAEDGGGTRGRTIDFHLDDGRLRIKKFGQEEEFI